MGRADKARLRLIDTSPEAGLRELFRQETEMLEGLRWIKAELARERQLYARKHGLLMLPSVEHLRRMFGNG